MNFEREMMRLSISEIFTLVEAAETFEDKVAMLHKHESQALKEFMFVAFDPSVKWLLPPGKPPYTPCRHQDQHSMLLQNVKKLVMFIEGYGYDDLRPYKRENLFIQLLESVDPSDASLLLVVKEREPFCPSITPTLIEAAYPGMITVKESVKKEIASKREETAIEYQLNADIAEVVKNTYKTEQPLVTSKSGTSKSGIPNICYLKRQNKYFGKKNIYGKTFLTKNFSDPEDALKELNRIIAEYKATIY